MYGEVPPVAEQQQAAVSPEPSGLPQALVPQVGGTIDLAPSEEETLASCRGAASPNAAAKAVASPKREAGVGARPGVVAGSASAVSATTPPQQGMTEVDGKPTNIVTEPKDRKPVDES